MPANIAKAKETHSPSTEVAPLTWEKRIAPALIIMAGVCWGIIGLFSRNLAWGGLSSVQITASRCIVTAVCLSAFLLIKDRDKLKINLKDLWLFLGTGICSIVFFNICYFTAIKLATLSIASILLYTAPCFVMIMSAVLFREPITKRKIGALILAFGGCVLIAGIVGNGSSNLSGLAILVGLGAGIGYALYSIFGSIALKKYHPYTVTAYTFIVASLSLLPFSNSMDIAAIALQNRNVLINGLLLGVVSTLIPFLLYTKGLEHMEAGKASVMAFVEPMVATLVGILIFKEQLTLQNTLGIFLIFLSVLVLNWRTRQKTDTLLG
ncbi:putative permease, DMT superfamily [Desulfitobacterium dichloroeliminans LMG P-21439]|uniref:Putative permease, DMT superfamily n=1 Tax=Desulfitobacterium dichloroeliminans (strain LMG P-21439 / DCA1) TaxID=871963 RepID=L0F7U3_DESDL|nr:EamA family transporter [Desulfitobacterium dichloroeliminans]AGA69090.1 putative permease, DMT superfamily [Desulfitobacterium dichloroeliminans LMG P-21439]